MENSKDTQYSDKISQMFSTIHKRYDLFNHLFSFGADYWWRYKLVGSITFGKTNKVLDMAAGTLDVSIAIAKQYPQSQIIAGDICEDMLAFGDEKVRTLAQKTRDKKESCLCKCVRTLIKKVFCCEQNTSCEKESSQATTCCKSENTMTNVQIVDGENAEQFGIDMQIKTQVMDAQAIPFEACAFDVCTIAFGIRNVENRLKAIEEMHRVLGVGGQLYILEFAPVHIPILGAMYHFYLEKVMPKLVKLFVGEEESYTYLAKSIKKFPLQEDFVKTIKEAGFSFVKYEKLTFGTVTLYTAIKSDAD